MTGYVIFKLENATYSIRVDGVEASGLGDDLNLIMGRSPRIDYFAKGAPQMVVEWMSKR